MEEETKDENAPKRIMVYTEAELRERKKHLGSTLSIFDRKKFEREFDPKTLNLSKEEMDIYRENPHIRQVLRDISVKLTPIRCLQIEGNWCEQQKHFH
jgi:hypothetical protein